MPAPGTLTSSLALLLLLAVARAGPFSPRPNVTLEAPRPPPHPGGRAAGAGEGSRPSQHYEHTVEGGEKQVVFTHRINLPPSGGCGCAPGAEPPAPASEVQALRVRLEVLEELVKGLKEQCSGGCCPSAAQAGTGQTDVRSLCSLHGVFDLGRCACSCEPGWGGPTCSDLTGTPASSPTPAPRSCPDDCNDQGRCVRGRCVCFPGYAGPSCSWPSCPGDCQGRGRCVQGACVCRAGFSGPDCSQRVCPRGCSQRGLCVDGRCVCDPGYSGEDCGARACPWDCGEGGRCVDGRCVCWPGYAGEDCGTRTCPRDCRGRGRCEDGECICDAGYSGDDCGVRSCPGDCSQRGRCEDGRCVCWPGYSGPDCGARACPRDCRGRGRCEDGVCVCHAGFAGEDCGVRGCPGDCRGRGRCESGRCVCWPGYTGRDCGSRACPGDCRGHGRCVDGVCVCDAGFAGEDCGSRRCPGDCSGRGRCENGVCVCEPGYTGPSCAVRTCPADCRGRGRCVQGVCVCHAGYGGEDCGEEEPPAGACPGGCGPRELCRAGQCVCVEGFRGPDCAIQTCPGDCRGRGECRQGGCVCLEGYAGEDCGEEVPAIEGMRMHLLEETTVRTEWTPAPGPVDAYEIQFIPTVEGGDPPFTARVPSSASAYDQRGLAPGQEYQVTVRALRGTSWGPPASKAITTMIDGPQDLRVVAVTPTTLELSWLRPLAEVDRFVVSYVSAGNQRVRLEVPPKADGTLLTDLMPGVEYVVTVTAERGRAVSYPASVRANTAPAPYSYPEVRPPAPAPQPRPRPRPAGPPRPARPSPPPEREKPSPGPSLPQPPRRAWGNLTAELGRFRGTVQDLERHLRARGYPLRGNQTYASVARHLHEFLLRRLGAPAGSPAPPAGPAPGTAARDSGQGVYSPGAAPRHPKPEVLGSSADGALLVSLDGLRGQFERVVLRWRPQPPAEGPGGELTVPGSARTARLPNLSPGTTYHVEAHGVRAGQTSKSYAFVTTTGTSPLGATDEPPPAGPSTTQGAEAPLVQRPQELGELRALGRDEMGRLHVAWTAQPDTFDHFRLHLQVPEGSGVHEELLPGDVRQALVPPPPPGAPYRLLLYGILPGNKPSVPIAYRGIMDEEEEEPRRPPGPPRLEELTVTTGLSSDSLLLRWTVAEGEFDSFVIQYKDKDGPQVVPVEGSQRSALVTALEPGRKYKFALYGLAGKKKHGPLVAEARILLWKEPSPETPPRLGNLWVTDPTADSLRVTWTVPEGQFDSFMIQYRGRDGRPQVVPVEGPERSATISSLDPDHKYRFSLFGIAHRKRYGPLTADGTTAPERKEEPPPEPPEPPEQPLLGELAVTSVTPDSLRLSWTVARGPFDSFVVQYKDAQGQPRAVQAGDNENELLVPGLESNRKYKMNLYGLRGRQRVGPVSVVAKTAPQEMPDPTEPSTEALKTPREPRLGELTVTDATPDSLSLSWTVPEGQFDHFLVQYRDGDGQPKVVQVPGHKDEVTVSGLEPDHKYKVTLHGFYGGQRVGPVSAVGVTAAEQEPPSPTEPSTEAPEPPEEPLLGELTVADASPDSLSLSWTVARGRFDAFTVQYKDGAGRPQVLRVGGEARAATVRGLDAGRKYKLNLYGLHQDGRVGPVSAVALTAPQPEETPPATEPPLEPRLGELTVTEVTPDSVGLAWTVPEGEFDSFVVQYKDREGQPQEVPVASDQLRVTVPTLEPGRRYQMDLYGLRGQHRVGPLSVVAETDPLPPAPVTEPPLQPRLGELTVRDVTPDSVGLLWTVPEGEFDSFVVQYKDKDGQPQLVPVTAGQREVTVPGLESSRKYKFLLFGIQDGKRRSPVSVEAKTALRGDPSPEAPPRLGELWVTDPTPDSLRLSWTVPEGRFDSFVVQFKSKDGPQAVPVEGHVRSVTVSPLDAGRKYRFLLYGLLGRKRLGPLAADGATEPLSAMDPPREQRPPKPQLGEELQVTGVTPDSVGLAWTVPQGQFDSFVVQYRDSAGQPRVVPVDGSLREVRILGLDPARRYKLLLYGLLHSKRVGPLSAIAMTAPGEDTEAEPEAPGPVPTEPRLGELTVEEATPHSLRLSWEVAEGELDAFEVQYTDRDGQPHVVNIEGHQQDVTLAGLESEHRYLVTLYGFHDGQRVGPVHIEALTLQQEEEEPREPPTTPEPAPKPRLGELTVTDTTPDSLSLSWTVPEGQFDHFLVQYRDGDGQPKVVQVPGHEDEVTVSGLEPDHKYKVTLHGFYGGQRVGPVSAVGVTATEQEPPSPTEPSTEAPEPPEEPLLGELTVADVAPDSLSLSWTVAQGRFDAFTVQYKDGAGRPQVLRVGAEARAATVRGLDAGRKYKLNLYGLHQDGRTGPVSVMAMTAPVEVPPDVPLPKPRLGELTVTDATPDSLSLSWTVPEGQFDHFLVQYRDGDGQPKVVQVPGHEDEVTVSGLEPDHKYKVTLHGFYGGQRVGPVSAVGVTDPERSETMTTTQTEPPTTTPEPAPKPRLGELTVTDATPDSLSLSWTVPEGQFDHFLVQYRDGDGQPKVVQVPGHEDEVTVSGLEPDHKYKVTLHGFYGGQRVGPVSAVGVTATEQEPPSPTEPSTEAPEPPEEPLLGELTVADASPDSLSLSWTVARGRFDAFTVQYKDGAGRPQVLRVGGEARAATVRGLDAGRKYKLNLYGLHQDGRAGPVSAMALTALQEAEEEEPPSPTEPSTEAPEPPEEPLLGELTVADASPDSLSLSWTVARGRFDAFTVQYKDGAGRPQVLRVGGEARAATVRGLDAGRKYKLNLYGLHQDGRAGPVSAEAVTAALPTQPPAEPLLGELAVASVTPDTVRLSWAVAEGPFDSFLVQYRDAQGQPQAVPVSGDLRQVTVSALHPARKYKFLLFGLQDGKRHGPASVDTKTLPDTNPSPRLGELTVTDTTPHSVGLAWTVPEGEFDSFVVQYKDKRGQPQIVPVAADQHKVTISGLEPNKRYKFLVYGLAGRKRLGPISAEGATAPLEETPQLPPRLGELAARGETPDSLRLSWTVAQGPFDSFLVQYRDTQGQLQAVPVAADQREFAVEGLEPGRTYEFLLYGLSGGQRLGPVSALGATAPEEDAPAPEDPEPPEAPRLGLLAVTEATPDSLRLSWSVAQGPFDSFVVQYEDTHGQPQALLVDGNQSKVVISSLEPSTSYRFFLYGLHEGKRQGPISTEGTTGPPPAGQTPGDPGPRLSRLSVTDVTTSSLRLDWEAPLGAFDSFLLRFGVPTPSTLEQRPRPPLQRELMVPGTRRWAVLRDLRPGTLYSLTLYGLRGPHKADSVQGTARTLSPVLESPRDLQLSDIRERSATVSWTPPPSRVDSFKVSYQLADGGEPQSVQVDGGAHTHRLQGLTPGARYEVTVVSVRGFEESEPLTGFLSTVPDGPTQLRALNLTEGSALLHWMPPRTPVDKYNVRVTAPGAAPLQGSAPGSAVDYPLRSLLVRTNYTATVRGLRGPNVTSPASITFTTGLQAPQDLEAKDVTPRTALLAWTEPQAPPTGYLLTFGAPGGRTQEIALPAGVTSHRLLGLFPSSRYSARLQAVWGQSLTPPLATSFTTGGLPVPFPRDCGEEMQNGGGSRATTIFLDGNRERPLSVFCDLETDGGGWLVFQRRVDGRTDFWRDWEDYAHGFGNVSGEFWLGNEALHSLTQAGDYSMRVDLRAGDEAVFAQYDSFRVDSAAQYYRLHLDGFHGTAGDSMSYHSGSVFSARDRDPNNLLISCAVSYRGAWWYRNCHYANLNGLYGSAVDHQGVTWYHWKGFDFSVPFTEMKLRPRSYRPPAQGG